MKKLLLLTLIVMVNTTLFGQIFTENFDGNWSSPAPSGWISDRTATDNRAWHRNDYTTYWNNGNGSPSTNGAQGSSNYARFHSYGINNAETATMTYNSNIDLSSYSGCVVNLSFYHINTGGDDNLDIEFSNDGGTSFKLFKRLFQSASWTKYTIPILNEYLVNNFRLRVKGDSENGYYGDIGLDQMSIDVVTPQAVLMANADATICPGTPQTLTATGGTMNEVYALYETFNNALPATWSTVNSSSGGTPADAAWKNRPNAYAFGETFYSNDATNFMLTDSYDQAGGTSSTTATELISPSFSLQNFTSATLSFYQYFRFYTNSSAKVEISENGGAYTTLATYTSTQGTRNNFSEVSINLSAYLGKSNLKIRFKYDAKGYYYWAIDNVSVLGNKQSITWSPTTNLYTDAGLTTSYVAGSHATTVYAIPATTTTYTASSTNCSKTVSDLVTFSTSTAVYENNAWTPALANNQSIELKQDYSLPSDMNVCSCKVNTDKTLTIPGGKTLTVQNAIDNLGTITVDNQGSLVQVNETDANTGSGQYNIKKTTGTYYNYDYFYWSSPVKDQTVGSVFSTINYKFTNNPQNYLDVKSGHGYPQPTTSTTGDGYDDNGDDWSYMPNATVMPRGIGFIAMGKDSPTSFSTSQMNIQQSAFTAKFMGNKVNNGTFTAPVYQDLYAPGTNANNNNLNLLGNPYPSAIDVYEFYHENASVLEGKFYFWTHDSHLKPLNGPNAYDFSNTNYAIGTITGTYPNYTYTQTVSSSGKNAPRYIASTQGFIASAKEGIASPSNVTYKNKMRVVNNNTSFLRQSNNLQPTSRVWLNMTSANSFNQIAIGFDSTTEDVYGMGDTPRLDSGNDTDLYTIINNDLGHYAIQFLSAFEESKTVALGMEILQAGDYQIAIDHFDGVFSQGQAIYLEDTYLNIIHDLNLGAYSFNQVAGQNINDRFILRFTNNSMGNDSVLENQITVYPNPSKGMFYISNLSKNDLNVEVFDINGNKIGIFAVENNLDLSNYAKGIYFAKFYTDKRSMTLKLVIE